MTSRNFDVYLITNRNLVSEESYFKTIKDVGNATIGNIILREKDLSDEQYKRLYYKVKSLVNDSTKIIINSKIKVFKEVSEKTLHLPFKDFMELEKVHGLIGVSIHSVEEGILADKKGASYILASHIFETKCKEGLKPKGLNFIKDLRRNVKCKIIALGGINTENYKSVINAGADGIAIMSLMFFSNDVSKLLNELR